MKNRMHRGFFLIFFSTILSVLIFILLSYTGIALKFINALLRISGNDHWQGETKTPYIFNSMFILIAFIFVIVLLILSRYFFRKTK
jgi:hypothetical protein